jgi:DNA-binding transcriptional regulator GbsR (MarR family)
VLAANRAGDLSFGQQAIVDVCAEAVQQLGLSRSVGQIYGVIYGSPDPLSFADVVACLGLSKGSVSQGLRFLRELGAVKRVAKPGDRREYFVPVTELRRLIAGVLQTRMRAPLRSGVDRLRTIERQLAASDEPHSEFLQQRISGLQSWHRKALFVLPLIQGLLGPGRG